MRTSRFLRAIFVLALAAPSVFGPSACGNKNEPLGVGQLCDSDLQCMPGLICKGNPRRCSQLGQACDLCTRDPECAAGLFCVQFNDGSQRCGSGVGATTCRVSVEQPLSSN